MIRGLFVLLLCQLAGEVLARGLGLPVPGPVLGLLMLFAGLQAWPRREDTPEGVRSEVGRVADGLLANLALLFVPAGVGVVQHWHLLAEHGIALAVVLVGSTALTLVVTALVFVGVARLMRTAEERP